MLSVYPTYIEVQGGSERIAIYEYKDVKSAVVDSMTISSDGYSVGNAIVEWVEQPHFYQNGKLIISYIGSNRKLQDDLEAILGDSITD